MFIYSDRQLLMQISLKDTQLDIYNSSWTKATTLKGVVPAMMLPEPDNAAVVPQGTLSSSPCTPDRVTPSKSTREHLLNTPKPINHIGFLYSHRGTPHTSSCIYTNNLQRVSACFPGADEFDKYCAEACEQRWRQPSTLLCAVINDGRIP